MRASLGGLGTIAVIMGAAPACQLLVDFAAIPLEICNDGIDNDFDEAIDCRDRDCDGQCQEACLDGFDNDLDGLVDRLDPLCWPNEQIVRCATVRGSAYALTSSNAPAGVRFGSDPTGLLRSPVAVIEGRDLDLELPMVLTGDLRLTFTATVFLGVAADSFEVEFFGEIAAGTAAGTKRFGIRQVRTGEPQLYAQWPNVTVAATAPILPAEPQWLQLSLRDGQELELRTLSGSTALARVSTPSSLWPSTVALRVVLRGQRTERRWLFGGLQVARGDHLPCTPVSVPSLADPEVTVVFGSVVARGFDCLLLGNARGAVVSARAETGLGSTLVSFDWSITQRWSRLSTLSDLRDPSLAFDPSRGVFVAVAHRYGDSEPLLTEDIVLLESESCADWAVVGSAFPAGGAPPGVIGARGGNVYGYAIERARIDAPLRHELLVRGADEVVYLTSSKDGAPGTFTEDPEVEGFRPNRRPRPDRPNVWIGRVGRKLLSVTQSQRPGWLGFSAVATGALVIGEPQLSVSGGAIAEVSRLLLTSSGIPGTFDGWAVRQGVLALSPMRTETRIEGRLYYSAQACRGCPTEVGVAPFIITRDN